MDKIKKLFHNNKRKDIVIVHPHLDHLQDEPLEEQHELLKDEPEEQQKKKRFSLNMLKSTEPNNNNKKKDLSKSTSFLQLNSLFQPNPNLKRSKSMLGYFYDTPLSTPSSAKSSTTSLDDTVVTTPTTTTENKRQIYLQLGIQFYEKSELENATHYWKLSATEDITPLGIFFYGLALLHGWGCRKSPAIAVRYLQKTANTNALDELEAVISRSISSHLIQSLAVSIYEVGASFWHGWEVPKNVTIAAYYFDLASKMGNANAMNDLGFCFKYGHGVTKDSFRAAKLYKSAAKLGFDIENNSWVWDSKYDEV